MRMETGRNVGMQLMDQALLEAVQNKLVDPNDAYLYAQDKKPFLQYLTDTTLLPAGAAAE